MERLDSVSANLLRLIENQNIVNGELKNLLDRIGRLALGFVDFDNVDLAGSAADGSNFARLFGCPPRVYELEYDFMIVPIELPPRETQELIYDVGDLNLEDGTVNLIWNRRLVEFVGVKYLKYFSDDEGPSLFVEGTAVEPRWILDKMITDFPMAVVNDQFANFYLRDLFPEVRRHYSRWASERFTLI